MNKEMLTRQLLALDSIEPDGDTGIRKIRKESIHSVNSLLDSKVRDMTTDHDGSSDRMDLAELTELNTEMLNSARELLRIKSALKKLMNKCQKMVKMEGSVEQLTNKSCVHIHPDLRDTSASPV